MEYYDMNRSSFEGYLKIGMPVRLINGKRHGREDNIDEFFPRLTAFSEKNPSEGFWEEEGIWHFD